MMTAVAIVLAVLGWLFAGAVGITLMQNKRTAAIVCAIISAILTIAALMLAYKAGAG